MLDVGIWALTDSELLALVTDRANLVVFVSLVTFSLTAPFVLEFIRCTVKNDGWLIRLPQMAALVLLAADAAGWLLAGQPMLWLLMPIHITVIASILAAFHTLMVSYKKEPQRRGEEHPAGFRRAGSGYFCLRWRPSTAATGTGLTPCATAPVCWDFW